MNEIAVDAASPLEFDIFQNRLYNSYIVITFGEYFEYAFRRSVA